MASTEMGTRVDKVNLEKKREKPKKEGPKGITVKFPGSSFQLFLVSDCGYF